MSRAPSQRQWREVSLMWNPCVDVTSKQHLKYTQLPSNLLSGNVKACTAQSSCQNAKHQLDAICIAHEGHVAGMQHSKCHIPPQMKMVITAESSNTAKYGFFEHYSNLTAMVSNETLKVVLYFVPFSYFTDLTISETKKTHKQNQPTLSSRLESTPPTVRYPVYAMALWTCNKEVPEKRREIPVL